MNQTPGKEFRAVAPAKSWSIFQLVLGLLYRIPWVKAKLSPVWPLVEAGHEAGWFPDQKPPTPGIK